MSGTTIYGILLVASLLAFGIFNFLMGLAPGGERYESAKCDTNDNGCGTMHLQVF